MFQIPIDSHKSILNYFLNDFRILLVPKSPEGPSAQFFGVRPEEYEEDSSEESEHDRNLGVCKSFDGNNNYNNLTNVKDNQFKNVRPGKNTQLQPDYDSELTEFKTLSGFKRRTVTASQFNPSKRLSELVNPLSLRNLFKKSNKTSYDKIYRNEEHQIGWKYRGNHISSERIGKYKNIIPLLSPITNIEKNIIAKITNMDPLIFIDCPIQKVYKYKINFYKEFELYSNLHQDEIVFSTYNCRKERNLFSIRPKILTPLDPAIFHTAPIPVTIDIPKQDKQFASFEIYLGETEQCIQQERRLRPETRGLIYMADPERFYVDGYITKILYKNILCHHINNAYKMGNHKYNRKITLGNIEATGEGKWGNIYPGSYTAYDNMFLRTEDILRMSSKLKRLSPFIGLSSEIVTPRVLKSRYNHVIKSLSLTKHPSGSVYISQRRLFCRKCFTYNCSFHYIPKYWDIPPESNTSYLNPNTDYNQQIKKYSSKDDEYKNNNIKNCNRKRNGRGFKREKISYNNDIFEPFLSLKDMKVTPVTNDEIEYFYKFMKPVPEDFSKMPKLDVNPRKNFSFDESEVEFIRSSLISSNGNITLVAACTGRSESEINMLGSELGVFDKGKSQKRRNYASLVPDYYSDIEEVESVSSSEKETELNSYFEKSKDEKMSTNEQNKKYKKSKTNKLLDDKYFNKNFNKQINIDKRDPNNWVVTFEAVKNQKHLESMGDYMKGAMNNFNDNSAKLASLVKNTSDTTNILHNLDNNKEREIQANFYNYNNFQEEKISFNSLIPRQSETNEEMILFDSSEMDSTGFSDNDGIFRIRDYENFSDYDNLYQLSSEKEYDVLIKNENEEDEYEEEEFKEDFDEKQGRSESSDDSEIIINNVLKSEGENTKSPQKYLESNGKEVTLGEFVYKRFPRKEKCKEIWIDPYSGFPLFTYSEMADFYKEGNALTQRLFRRKSQAGQTKRLRYGSGDKGVKYDDTESESEDESEEEMEIQDIWKMGTKMSCHGKEIQRAASPIKVQASTRFKNNPKDRYNTIGMMGSNNTDPDFPFDKKSPLMDDGGSEQFILSSSTDTIDIHDSENITETIANTPQIKTGMTSNSESCQLIKEFESTHQEKKEVFEKIIKMIREGHEFPENMLRERVIDEYKIFSIKSERLSQNSSNMSPKDFKDRNDKRNDIMRLEGLLAKRNTCSNIRKCSNRSGDNDWRIHLDRKRAPEDNKISDARCIGYTDYSDSYSNSSDFSSFDEQNTLFVSSTGKTTYNPTTTKESTFCYHPGMSCIKAGPECCSCIRYNIPCSKGCSCYIGNRNLCKNMYVGCSHKNIKSEDNVSASKNNHKTTFQTQITSKNQKNGLNSHIGFSITPTTCTCLRLGRFCDPDFCKCCDLSPTDEGYAGELIGPFSVHKKLDMIKMSEKYGCLARSHKVLRDPMLYNKLPLKDICLYNDTFNNSLKCQLVQAVSVVKPCVGIAKSKIHGMGLFALTTIYQGEFIGFYAGECISSFETERRGLLADTVMASYIFSLVNDSEKFAISDAPSVDAGKFGSFTRWANNETKYNCEGKTYEINGRKYILFFASKKINSNEEIVISYHWDESHNKKHGVHDV